MAQTNPIDPVLSNVANIFRASDFHGILPDGLDLVLAELLMPMQRAPSNGKLDTRINQAYSNSDYHYLAFSKLLLRENTHEAHPLFKLADEGGHGPSGIISHHLHEIQEIVILAMPDLPYMKSDDFPRD